MAFSPETTEMSPPIYGDGSDIFEAPHVYRNRDDDNRGPAELHFCAACNGWYGVPHNDSHCQKREAWGGTSDRRQCACRFCRESLGLPRQGTFGFVSRAKAWKP